jgi:hypothetical protein
VRLPQWAQVDTFKVSGPMVRTYGKYASAETTARAGSMVIFAYKNGVIVSSRVSFFSLAGPFTLGIIRRRWSTALSVHIPEIQDTRTCSDN